MLCTVLTLKSRLQRHFRNFQLTEKENTFERSVKGIDGSAVDTAKETKGYGENCNKGMELTTAIAPRLRAVYAIAMTPTSSTEPTSAEFLTKQSKDPFSCQLGSYVRTPGFDYSYICNGVLIGVAPINADVQILVSRSIHACFLQAYHYSQPAKYLSVPII